MLIHLFVCLVLLIFRVFFIEDYGVEDSSFRGSGIHDLDDEAPNNGHRLEPLSTFSRSSLPIIPPHTDFMFRYVRHVRASYCSLPNVQIVNIGSTLAIVEYDTVLQSIVVSFRGSKDWINWFDNLQWAQTAPWYTVPHVKVHRGFWQAYMRIRKKLPAAITSVIQANRETIMESPESKGDGVAGRDVPVTVTGHSLGGALAMLFALDSVLTKTMKKLKFSVASVVTFGAPRVGNLQFVNLFNSNIPNMWRVIHTNDIIPLVPEKKMPCLTPSRYHHFEHAGTLHVFDPDFQTLSLVCTPGKAHPECDNYDSSVANRLRLLNSIQSHLIYFNTSLSNCSLLL